jgi:phospholipid/cholesterol/gamma-HCH transport system substrate-binding protein
MTTRKLDAMKLGLFVIIGLAVLIFALFMIGQNTNLFEASYSLSARFRSVGGLRQGNNVRYGGIEVGTVRRVIIVDDTTMRVDMTIKSAMKSIIRKDASTGIATDGLIGNRVVNIFPGSTSAAYAVDGDMLLATPQLNTEEMMATLAKSNRNIFEISEKLKATITRLNNSEGLWKILNDSTLSTDLKRSLLHIEKAAGNAEHMTASLNGIVDDVKSGKGNLGTLLRDSGIVMNLGETVANLKKVSGQAEQLATHLDKMAMDINEEIQTGHGTVHTLLRDTAMAGNLSRTLVNVENGTAKFDENMKALQQNWFFRGYFRNQEKQKKAGKQ